MDEAKAKLMSAAEKKAQEQKEEEIMKKEEKLQKILVKAAIRRQRENERFEIKLNLAVCFGDKIPKKKNELSILKGVTTLDVWMQPQFLYNSLKALKPEEIFHPIEVYALKWQPPRSRYVIMTPLDDPQLQENMLIQLHNMLPSERRKIIFCFGPQNPTMNLFAPRVHPSSLISYRTSDKVLDKLCNQYLEGRLSLTELQNILGSKYDVWRFAMYNLLPADEQEYHRYLTEPLESKASKDIDKLYLDDVINLQEYADRKYPDRKKKREVESLLYPRPYTYETCIVCGVPNKAFIQCQNCTNQVCSDCIVTYFLDEKTKVGSFLLLHRTYCLKLGKLVETKHLVVAEPSYLRDLRKHGRTDAVIKAQAIHDARVKLEEGDDVEEDDDDEEEMAKRRAEAERLRLLEEEEEKREQKERPPEFLAIVDVLEGVIKKLVKQERDILDYQFKLDEAGHTEQFISRVSRLKQDAVAKADTQIRKKLVSIMTAINGLKLEGEYAPRAIKDCENCLIILDNLKVIESVDDYHLKTKMLLGHGETFDEPQNEIISPDKHLETEL